VRYLTVGDDKFTEMLTRLDFGTPEPHCNGQLFGDNPGLEQIPADIVQYGRSALLLVKDTGSWCLLDRVEVEVYKATQGRRLDEILSQFPGIDLCQLREFVLQLYWRGLLQVNGRSFLEPDVLATGPIFVSSPLFLMVPTERCNLACRYCFADSGPSKTSRMDWETARKTVNLIIDFPADCLTIEFAGGEPLLEFDLIKKTVNYTRDRADRRGKAVQFLMQTNATLTTAPVAGLIKDLDIRVSLSLDGDPERNNMTRCLPGDNGAYEAIERGMSVLRRENIAFGVICVVSKSNYRDLPNVLAHFSSLGLKEVKLNPVFELGRAHESSQAVAVTPEEYLEAHSVYLDYVEAADNPVLDENTVYMVRNLASRMRPYRCMRSQCGAGADFLTFTPSGEIYPCSRFRGRATLALGNVASTTRLDGIWKTSPVMSKLSDRKAEAIPECRKCSVKRFCEAGCPLDSYDHFGSFDAVHPWCAYYREIYFDLLRRIAEAPNLAAKLCPSSKIYSKAFFERLQ
jgi:uncharacterized protein